MRVWFEIWQLEAIREAFPTELSLCRAATLTYRCLQVSVENLGIAARNEHRRDDEQLLAIRTYIITTSRLDASRTWQIEEETCTI